MSSIFRYLFRTTFFIFALFSFVNFADATTYYVDATGGSNTNNGTSEVTAWQTVSKAVGFALMPGDIVLFKKGETFNGTLTMNRSGSAGNLITFGTYGTGANPVINSGASYAVDIQNRSYLRFENLSIQGASTGQALVYGTISDIQFDGVSFTGGAYNVYVLSGTQTGISFNNCTFSNSTTVGLSLSAATVNFSLTNSSFSGGVIGLLVDSSNTSNITVSNTTFSSHSSYGLSSATGSNIITGTFNNLTVSGNSGAGMFFQGSASNLSLTNSTFSSNAGGVKIEPSTSKVVSNLTLSNLNTSSNAGIGISLGGAGSGSGVVASNLTSNSNTPGGGGIKISRTWSNVSVSDSTFRLNGGDGVQLYLDNVAALQSNISFTNVVADNNTSSGFQLLGTTGTGSGVELVNVSADNNYHDGINVKGNWTNVNISGCTANENGVTGLNSDGDGISYHNSTTGSIKYCFISNNMKSAVAHVGDSDLDMSYNIFRHDTTGVLNAVVYLEGTGVYSMYNNTIYSGAQIGSGVELTTPTGPTLTFKNNIIYGFATGFKKTAGTLTEDYNLIYNTGTANYSGLTAGSHSISVDPLFTNAGSNDFTLQSTSPAIDSGVTVSSTYDDALHPNTVFVSSVNTVDQDLRGSGWELGAYIYPVPQAPTIGAPSVLSSSSARFAFTDNSSDETGFKLYSSADSLLSTDSNSNLTYIDGAGLAENSSHSLYYVKAYNSYGSSVASGGSTAVYTLAPTPSSITSTAESGSVVLSAPTFNNDSAGSSGYYFVNNTTGGNSGWIQTPSWSDSGLSCSTPYSYSVKYRNSESVETSSFSTALNTSGCSRHGSISLSSINRQYIQPDVVVTPKTIPANPTTVSDTNGGGLKCNVSSDDLNIFITSKKILKFGSKGEDVKTLQSCLKSYGKDIYPSGIVNGTFGPLTRQAVKNFQTKYSLKSDGIVGPKVKGKILNITN